MPPLSALYVNIEVRPRFWAKRAVNAGAWLTAHVDRVSPRAADWLGGAIIALCVRFGYVVEVRR